MSPAAAPGYQRWAGSQVSSECSNVMIAGNASLPVGLLPP
jgi:hypothetical protein